MPPPAPAEPPGPGREAEAGAGPGGPTRAAGSARRRELLDRSYAYVLEHGLGDLSLRPLAAAVGSSPRVLLYLFGSKDGLVRELLARAREEEAALLRHATGGSGTVTAVWGWLADPAHRPLLALWVEAYGRSLVDPGGPWGGFARDTVEDWLAVLDARDPAARTLDLAVLRGALLDLLATGDTERVSAAVARHTG